MNYRVDIDAGTLHIEDAVITVDAITSVEYKSEMRMPYYFFSWVSVSCGEKQWRIDLLRRRESVNPSTLPDIHARGRKLFQELVDAYTAAKQVR
jgi:hypothetical protein